MQPPPKSTLPFLLLFLILKPIHSLKGYNCNAPDLQITTFSLMNVGHCHVSEPNTESKDVHIELIQALDHDQVPVTQCRVTMKRRITYCGSGSHNYQVDQGIKVSELHLTREDCLTMHRNRIFTYKKKFTVGDLVINGVKHASVTIAGSVDRSGNCKYVNEYWEDNDVWRYVFVQAEFTITLKQVNGTYTASSGLITLPDGARCDYRSNHCVGADSDHSFWTSPFFINKCNRYGLLYSGMAKRVDVFGMKGPQRIYTVTDGEMAFALKDTGSTEICNLPAIRTEHPKLFIAEVPEGEQQVKRREVLPQDLDLFAYVNAKFLFAERYTQGQLGTMFLELQERQCELEKQMLLSALGNARSDPEQLAYEVMKKPGYYAVVAGEVAHLVKCKETEVEIRNASRCYMELPVSWNGVPCFLTPRNRILTEKGTEVNCDKRFPVMYKMRNHWIKINEKFGVESTPAPVQIQPERGVEVFTAVSDETDRLGECGIYTMEDLHRVNENMMVPVKRPCMKS